MTASNGYEPMAFAIETERLFLRLRDVGDATWYLELLGEHPGGTTRSLADARVHLGDQRERTIADGIGFLAIERRARDPEQVGAGPIGYCGLLVGRHSFDEPEIAYELLRHAHGHGYATEAACAVVEATFATGRRRVWATVRIGNEPSFRVLERIGFRRDHVTTDDDGELVHLVRDA